MAMIRMVARRAFDWRGRALKPGDAFEVPALDAAILRYRRRADFGPRAPRKLNPPPFRPVVDSELDPPVVTPRLDDEPAVPTVDEVREPKHDPPSATPRNPRHTKRRDLEPEP